MMRPILILLLVLVLLFCVFGFMATFEPMERSVQLGWRFAYGSVGMACLAGVAWLGLFRR